MPSVKAELLIEAKNLVTSEANKAAASITGVSKAAGNLNNDLKRGFGQATQALLGFNIATLGVAGGIGAMGLALKYSIDQAAEAQKIMAQTEAVIKSTGGAAGLTAENISRLAGRLSLLTATDDEAIQSGANLLLTFKAVKSDAFEPAMQAALDMSTALGTDLRGSVLMLGKALEDPARGLLALRRAGVSFTVQQQDQIKALVASGKALEAQKMILEEINKEFGGSAAAAADTYAGKVKALKIQTDNLAQSFGELLLPTLTDVAEGLLHEAQLAGIAGLMFGKLTGAISEDEYQMRGAALMAGDLTAALYGLNDAAKYAKEGARGSSYELGTMVPHLKGVGDAADGKAAPGLTKVGKSAGSAIKPVHDLTGELAALEAGLAGDMQTAMDDYNAVVAETQPEIDKLVADIARMNAAQGKTWTVTKEATASIEEYERAQLKAGAAQKAVNEFTEGSREEYLDLVIAAQKAAEQVTKLGGEMGMSETFTANYTKKIAESKATLEELYGKLSDAEAALRRTTNEFIYQQLAIDGNIDANLEMARSLGLISEADYAAAKSAQDLKAEYAKDKDLENYLQNTKDLALAIASLQDKHIEITVETIHTERINQITTAYVNQTYGGTIGSGGGQGGGSNSTNWPGGIPGGAHGLSMIVPPGYPNDSYLVRASSGERVDIAPAGRSGNGPLIGTVNVYGAGGDPEAVAEMVSTKLAGKLRRALSGGVGAIGT